MCRELTLNHAAAVVVNAADRQVLEVNNFSGSREQVFKIEEIESSLFESVSRTLDAANTIQEGTPAPQANAPYQIRLPSPEPTPAPTPSKRSLPLRSRTSSKRTTSGKVWQVSQPALSAPPMCSGDPTNCPACKDDDFGRAFCVALGSASSAGAACSSCPNPEACGKAPRSFAGSNSTDSSASVGAPGPDVIDLTGKEGDEIQRTSATNSSTIPSTEGSTSLAPSNANPTPTSGDSERSETIPVNEA